MIFQSPFNSDEKYFGRNSISYHDHYKFWHAMSVPWHFCVITRTKFCSDHYTRNKARASQLDEPLSFSGNRQRNTFMKLLKCGAYECTILYSSGNEIIAVIKTHLEFVSSFANYKIDFESVHYHTLWQCNRQLGWWSDDKKQYSSYISFIFLFCKYNIPNIYNQVH